MRPVVEPVDGHELERMITAPLNATGVVHRVIEGVEPPPDADGVEVIGIAADRLRGIFSILAEHRGDEELALVTDVLAEVTLLTVSELGLNDCLETD